MTDRSTSSPVDIDFWTAGGELGAARLGVLQAVADGLVDWIPVPPNHSTSALMRSNRRGKGVDCTPATNWLRSYGLIRVPQTVGTARTRRRFVITALGEQALEAAAGYLADLGQTG